MVSIVKPRREEIVGIVGSNPRLVRAFEALFEQTAETTVSDSDFLLLQAYLSTGISRASALLAANELLTVRTITASGAVLITDQVVLCDASSANLTVTLPAASSSLGRELRIKKTDTTSKTVTLSPIGPDLIDDSAAASFSIPCTSLTVTSDGTNWWII